MLERQPNGCLEQEKTYHLVILKSELLKEEL